MVDRISNDSEFWYTVGLIYNQFQGLMEGYNSVAEDSHVSLRSTHQMYGRGTYNSPQKLDIFAFDLLNGVGDFIDIANFLFRERRPDAHSLTGSQLKSMVYTCLHIITLLPYAHKLLCMNIRGFFMFILAALSKWSLLSSHQSPSRLRKHLCLSLQVCNECVCVLWYRW